MAGAEDAFVPAGAGDAFRHVAAAFGGQSFRGGVFTCPISRAHQEFAEYTQRAEDGTKLGTVKVLEPLKNDSSVRNIDLPPFRAQLFRYHLDDWPYEFTRRRC